MKLSSITAILLIVLGFTFVPEDDFISNIKTSIEAYNKKYAPVTLRLNFNQPYYTVGDTISFSAFYLNLATHTAVAGKQIANLELFDHQGVAVLREKYVIKQGVAGAELGLPPTITPGFYTLISYTDWMKNFDPKLFFKKTIKVVDQFQINPTLGPVPVEFFAEGGHFISGVENNIVLRIPATSSNITGIIKNGNDIISEVNFNEEGFASATIIPTAGINYTLELKSPAGSSTSLPAAEPSGVSLRVRFVDDKATAKLFFTPDLISDARKFYLLVINTNTVSYSTRLDQSKISQEIVISPRQINGSSVISILSDDGKVWSSRAIDESNNAAKANIQLPRNQFSVRDSLEADVLISDENGPLDGSLSISVFNKNLFGSDKKVSLTDELSLVQNKDWLNWNMITSRNITDPIYKTEQYLTIEGEALLAATNKPVQDSTLLMFYFEKQILGYEVYVLNGKFKVPVFFDFTQPDMVFFAASRKGKDLKGVTLKLKQVDPQSGNYASIPSASSKIEDPYGSFKMKTKLINSSFSYFSQKIKTENPDPNFLIEDELGGADLVVNLKDFLVFPTMAEVVREVLPAVDHRKIGGENMIKIYTTHKRPVNNAEPVYIIDGVITKSSDAFLSLNPADVLTIKVVKTGGKLIRLGTLFNNGAILVRTKNNAGLNLNRENIFPIRGLLPATKNARTVPVVKNNIPNFNACLYWNAFLPVKSSESKINFATSDDIGDFEVKVEGVTFDGRFVTGSETFNVSPPKQ